MNEPDRPMSHRLFIERLIIALAIVGLALFLWQLRGLLILLFGAVLVAVILRVIANPIERRFRIPDGIALLISVLILLAVFGIAFWLFGRQVIAQADALSDAIPKAWQAVQERLAAIGLEEPLRQWRQGLQDGDGVVSNLGGVAMSIGNGIADTLLVIVGGIFMASNPDLYRRGIIKLVPQNGRELAAHAFDDSWKALRLWLFGRLVSMILVGLLTGIGLWWIGIPGALTLGIVAALLEFVPFIGPILAAIPAIVLALAVDPTLAFWVAGLFLVIQQIEGNIIAPLVQQRAVTLPPALLLFSLVAAGLIFGIVGILFAEPLTVVIYVLVKRLYVREALHTETPIPGEDEDED